MKLKRENCNILDTLSKVLQLIIQGRRSVGRRRVSLLRNSREWFGITSSNIFKAAGHKVRIAMMIANLRHGEEDEEENERMKSFGERSGDLDPSSYGFKFVYSSVSKKICNDPCRLKKSTIYLNYGFSMA